MLIPILHSIDWILIALNTQLIEGSLLHSYGTGDTFQDKFSRWLTNPSALKGRLGLMGLGMEILLLWLQHFDVISG